MNATRGGEISHERIRHVYGKKGEQLEHREPKLSRVETTMGHQKSGHHPGLKYWLHKIGHAVDTISRKYGIGEDTVEHVVHDCP